MSPLAHGVRSAFLAVVATVIAVSASAQGAAPAATPPSSPAKGDVVRAFETTTIDGKPQKVDFPKGSKTVLLFFLSGCPACHKMIPEWNRAYERRPKQLRVIGVLMDQEPPGFWSAVSIQFPVLRAPGREFLRSLNVNRAPLTLRVVEGGKVEDLGLGPVDPIRLGELFRP
jgi:peroxiredoxin